MNPGPGPLVDNSWHCKSVIPGLMTNQNYISWHSKNARLEPPQGGSLDNAGSGILEGRYWHLSGQNTAFRRFSIEPILASSTNPEFLMTGIILAF